jgi:hypothetical protein
MSFAGITYQTEDRDARAIAASATTTPASNNDRPPGMPIV